MGTGVVNPQGELDSNASKGVRNRTISSLVEQAFSALKKLQVIEPDLKNQAAYREAYERWLTKLT